MRIAAGGFQHETNSFAPGCTDYTLFAEADGWPALCSGDAMFEAFSHPMNVPISGFLDTAWEHGWYIEPLTWASATPGGLVTTDAFDRISGLICEGLLASAKDLDGVYLDLHGAMVVEDFQDGEGELLRRVRAVVGPDLPIVVSLDLHANVTRAMVEHADVLEYYRTYPHIDMGSTGARAADMLAHLVKTGERPKKSFHKLDFLTPVTAQCTMMEPAKSLYELLEALPADVTSASIATGFAPADIEECGPSVVAYGTGADKFAAHLRDEFVAREGKFQAKLWPPDEVVAYAMNHDGPIVVADALDNPGGGAPGDAIGLLKAMIEGGAESAVMAVLWDPAAAETAMKAGEGAEIMLTLGAHSGGAPGEEPLEVMAVVERTNQTSVHATGPFYQGAEIDLGASVLLRIGGVHVVVGSRRVQCADRAMISHFGLRPEVMRLVAVKSAVHFRADFTPMAKEILVAAGRGPDPADQASRPYQHLRPELRLSPNGPIFRELT